MYLLHYDGETTVHDSREQAVNKLLEDADACLGETKLSPEVMTVHTHSDVPFSMLDVEDRIVGLFDTLATDSPVGRIARHSVCAELELVMHEKQSGRDPPSDLCPTDCDDWEYKVRAWFEDRVNTSAFDSEVVVTVRQQFVDATRDEIQARWSDISDRIGNPAHADVQDIEQEIDRLEQQP